MTYYVIEKFPSGHPEQIEREWISPDLELAQEFVSYMMSQQEKFVYTIKHCPALPSMNNKSI